MKLPQIFALHPDTHAAEELLDRINRTHFGQRLRVSVKAGIPSLPRRKVTPDSLLGQIPASSYHAGQRAVLLHPAVLHRKPPRFVLRYLIHHGLMEAYREHTSHVHGCHHVLCPILAYGSRVNRWLAGEGFPPLHDDLPLTSTEPPPPRRPTMARTVNGDMIQWHEAVVPILVDDASANLLVIGENAGKRESDERDVVTEPDSVATLSQHQHAFSNTPAAIPDNLSNSLPPEKEDNA